jgi:hypothetical protein
MNIYICLGTIPLGAKLQSMVSNVLALFSKPSIITIDITRLQHVTVLGSGGMKLGVIL